jgi:leucyl-tRNA synthetase
MAVQVNGKLRATIKVPVDSADDVVVAAACAEEKVKRQMEGMQLVKTIVVKNKLVNLILKPAR